MNIASPVRARLARLRAWLFDQRRESRPPARVLASIRDQQDRSEILVSVVQLGVVAFFTALYANAPMARGQVQDYDLVPYFLAIYFAFTVLRLFLAWQRRLAPWLLYISVVADMALLMGIIWTFHLKYGQPPGFYLKATTFIYVFLFIALRALRFEARYVLFAGAVACIGWIALVIFALGITDRLDLYGIPRAPDCEAHPCVTDHYLDYMHRDWILIGAEIDKLTIVVLTTAILALAILRARRLLEHSIAEGIAARDLSRFLDPTVAKRIRHSEIRIAAGEGELRDAAILTTDLRGFTKLSQTMSPDDVVKLLQDYQERICGHIQAHGGSIDKFLGDGILCSFGATELSDSYAADALRAADALAGEVAAWNAERRARALAPMQVGLAIASGRVLFGAVGSADRLEYTVIGDAVNLAAKLEKHTKVEAVPALADAATWKIALAQGYQPPAEREIRRNIRVAGVGEPLDLVCLA